jgi:AraC-like DNA-binding protein
MSLHQLHTKCAGARQRRELSRLSDYDGPVIAVSQAHSGWVTTTRHTIARLRRELTAVDVDEIETLVRSTVDAIAPAPDAVDRDLLSLLLIEVCRRIVLTLHEPHVFDGCACYRAAWLDIARMTNAHVDDPRQSFLQWTAAFIGHFRGTHPPDGVTRAAALVRGAPTRTWTLIELSHAVHSEPRRLSRDFQSRFGLRTADYLHLARTAKALGLMRTAGKVESVVCDVGYRSKKDFYAAFRRWVGMTPTDLRALPDEERDWMELQLRSRLFRRAQTSREEIGERETPRAVTSLDSSFAILAHGREDTPACRQRPPHRQSARRRHR